MYVHYAKAIGVCITTLIWLMLFAGQAVYLAADCESCIKYHVCVGDPREGAEGKGRECQKLGGGGVFKEERWTHACIWLLTVSDVWG